MYKKMYMCAKSNWRVCVPYIYSALSAACRSHTRKGEDYIHTR
jgi:hypothetical protein